MSCYLITSFCWIVATTVVTWLNDFGRLCGPGGWDVATATFHTYPALKDDIGQVLHSILIADQVTVSTGFPFHCYDGIYWFDVSGGYVSSITRPAVGSVMELQAPKGRLNMSGRLEIIRSRWVCGRSLAGISGSNSAGGMSVCLLRVLWVVR